MEARNSGQQVREVKAAINRRTLPLRIRFEGSGTENCLPLRPHAACSDDGDRRPVECPQCVLGPVVVRDAARASLSPVQDGNGCDGNSRETIGEDETNRSRFAGVSFGRLTERCKTLSWWRSARISNCSAARLRNEAERDAKSAKKSGPKGDQRKIDNLQLISQFGIYENDNTAAILAEPTNLF